MINEFLRLHRPRIDKLNNLLTELDYKGSYADFPIQTIMTELKGCINEITRLQSIIENLKIKIEQDSK